MNAAIPKRLIHAAAAAVLALLCSAGLQAAVINPALERELKGRAPPDEVAVIVSLTDKVDLRPFETKDRRFRDTRLFTALKEKAAVTQAPLLDFLKGRRANRLRELWAINGIAVTVRADVIRELALRPGVESIRPDSILQAPAVTYGSPAPPAWNLNAVSAPDLWAQGYEGAGVVVANMDTGVDPLHPDLAGKWRGGGNSWFDPHGEHPTPHDANGHGTQTMSIMAGGAASGSAIGVAPGASWIAAKLYNDAGQASYSDIHLAFQWLLDPDGDPATVDAPDVVNASWGLVGTAGQCIMEFSSDLDVLKAAGIAVAIAAGNDGPAPLTSLSPGNNPAGFSTGAVDSLLAVASFSARGQSACDGMVYPKMAAPGVNISAADLSFGGMPLYAVVSGTSYAAPHAAGVMALLIDAFPNASISELESALTQSAHDLGETGPDNSYGYGLVNAPAAYHILYAGAGWLPSINSAPVTTAIQGMPYTYAVQASDPSGSAITFSLDVAPMGMAIDAATGVISWTPDTAYAGATGVTVRATGARGMAATQAFSVTVIKVNTASLDCEFDAGTPVIYSVEGKTAGGISQNGPYVPVPPVSTAAQPRLTIVSAGMVEVPNPAYDGTPATAMTILRDHGFGASQGSGTVTLNGTTLPIVSWSDGVIVARVPYGASTGQLQVTRGNGKASVTGVTVTVGGYGPAAPNTIRVVTPGTKIQAAIDAAIPGDLIMVPPGTYDEFVIMNKKVRLQGWGAPATHINAAKVPADKLTAWRGKLNQLLAAGGFDLLPGQIAGPSLFATEEAPGILVVAKASGTQAFNNTRNARIDGFTISGSDNGGGIFVNGYARFLEISNNKLISNQGFYGGGIRIGHPSLANPGVLPANDLQFGGYTNALNNSVRIHHNHVAQNGGSNGAGGGISLHTGSHGYQVTYNHVCGNFSMGNGGGIGHLGRSDNGTIASNTVIFNQTFNQLTNVTGGGIFIGGQASLAPDTAPTLSPGSGSVTVTANLVQGNQAGAGDGGGIRAEFVNGLDVRRGASNPTPWYQLTLTNNKVVNNLAGAAGGGISLQDTVKAVISGNTVANNDSTGTAGAAFPPGSPNQSSPQPSGIVSRAHSTLLFNTIGAASGYKVPYSNPVLADNIVWHNRSFYWAIDNATVPATFGLVPNVGAGQPAVYSDLAVLGTAQQGTWPGYTDAGAHKLNPMHSILTSTSGYDAGNSAADPGFVAQYFNGDHGQTGLTTSTVHPGPFDEGGNWITVRFGPLMLTQSCATPGTCPLYGDYRLQPYGGIGANP